MANPDDYEMIGSEHTDELDIQPRCARILRTVRPKYRLKKDRTQPPVVASAPEPTIPGTQCSAGLASTLLIDKYIDHLPLYRQSQAMERDFGLQLSRQTLTKWTHAAIDRLLGINEAIKSEVLDQEVLQIDETPIDYLEPGNKKTKNGYLWVARSPENQSVYYHWSTTRAQSALLELLELEENPKQSRLIQCDGYKVYESVAKAYPNLELGACLAHIRRKFLLPNEVESPLWAQKLLKQIQQLYAIERQLKEVQAPPDQRRETRQLKARPICNEIENLLSDNVLKYRPKEHYGRAINYAQSQWSQLKRYLEDGRMDIDNNGAENAIRPTKLGLKNWLFFGNANAGHASASIYTILQNCKSHGVNPREYLKVTFEALRRGKLPASELTPSKYAEATLLHQLDQTKKSA